MVFTKDVIIIQQFKGHAQYKKSNVSSHALGQVTGPLACSEGKGEAHLKMEI